MLPGLDTRSLFEHGVGKTGLETLPVKKSPINAASAITGGIGALTSAYNAFRFGDSLDDLNAQVGRAISTTGGYGYETQKAIDRDDYMSKIHKQNVGNVLSTAGTFASAASAAGPVAAAIGGIVGAGVGAIGGIFRKRKAEDLMNEQIARSSIYNDFAQNGAETKALQEKYMREYGNNNGQYLHAALGKDYNGMFLPGFDYANGFNSFVSQGEGIYDPWSKNATYVDHGPNDTAKAFLRPQDVVFGALVNPRTGRTFKKDAEPYIKAKEALDKKRPNTTDQATLDTYEKAVKPLVDEITNALDGLTEDQHKVMAYNEQQNNMRHFANGKPGLYSPMHGLIGGLGALSGLYQAYTAANDDVYKPNYRVRNPYLDSSINTLRGYRINSLPIINALRTSAADARYRDENSGGLSGGQKQISAATRGIGTQAAIANALHQTQLDNIKLGQAAEQYALQYGQQYADNLFKSLYTGDDVWMKSLAANKSATKGGIIDAMNALEQYAANDYKWKYGNAALDIWYQQAQNDIKNAGSGAKPGQVTSYAPTKTAAKQKATPISNNPYSSAIQALLPNYYDVLFRGWANK